MKPLSPPPPVTIGVLTFGNYAALAERAIGSLLQHIDRRLYRLIVGANAVGSETRRYLQTLSENGQIDQLMASDVNLGKCPMMRRMFEDVRTEFIWWFDDDSFVTSPEALSERLRIAQTADSNVVMWGERYMCENPCSFCKDDAVAFVRSATWYRELPPPFWEPGGKGEFNFEGKGTGDGRWIFLVGGGWFIRSEVITRLDWPDRRLIIFGEDVFLGEAIRQQGWEIQHIGKLGVEINTAPRRWNVDEEPARSRNLSQASPSASPTPGYLPAGVQPWRPKQAAGQKPSSLDGHGRASRIIRGRAG